MCRQGATGGVMMLGGLQLPHVPHDGNHKQSQAHTGQLTVVEKLCVALATRG